MMDQMKDKFYIYLPSNSSTSLFPNNRTSSYKVNLSTPLELNAGAWECALAEIIFPVSWHNIREGKNSFKRGYYPVEKPKVSATVPHERFETFPSAPKHRRVTYQSTPIWENISIPSGYYKNVQSIIDQLNKAESDWKASSKTSSSKISFNFKEISQKTIISVPKNNALQWGTESEDIIRCLGYEPHGNLKNEPSIRRLDDEYPDVKHFSSQNVSTTKYPYNKIFVYTDIIQNQNVGDYKVPLLRIVPVEKSWGEVCCVNYEKPHYFSVSRNRISVIEVNIRDAQGSLISFEFGPSIITLVFRRKTAKFFD